MAEIIQVLHSTMFDILVLILPVLIYLSKVAFRPSKIEADVLTKLLLPLIAYLARRLSDVHKAHNTDTHTQLNKVADDISNLKNLIKNDKRALG